MTFQEEFVPDKLERFEKLLKKNNNGDGWFVGDTVCVRVLVRVYAWVCA